MDCGLLVIVMGIGAFMTFLFGVALGVWSERLFCRERREANVYVIIWDDILAMRDIFVVSDRGVAEHLSRWVSLGKNSIRGTPVVSVEMMVCRIDDIPAGLRLDEVADDRR